MAESLLNKNFNPMAVNDVWAGDILKTGEGWMYLAVVMACIHAASLAGLSISA